MTDTKLDESVYNLAVAMKQVFQDAIVQAVEPVIDEIADSAKSLEEDIDTFDQDMHSMFAEQEKKIGKMIQSELGG